MDWPDDVDLDDVIPIIIIGAVQTASERTARSTGQPGCIYLHELLQSSPRRVYNVLRMKKETFILLCTWLEENTELQNSWCTTIQEQVAMFLWTLNYSASSRQIAEQFQHSRETVSW